MLGLDREQVAWVELLPEAKHVFSHVEWHMTGYRVVLTGGGALILFHGIQGGTGAHIRFAQCI